MQFTQASTVNFFDQWTPVKSIGTGSTCDVILVQENETLAKKVIKVFKSKVRASVAENEAKLMMSLNHPNIISASGYFPNVIIPQAENESPLGEENQQLPVIVLEYLSNGDLLGMIESFGALSESVAKTYFLQLVDAVEYLHTKNICHLDIKPDNILVDEHFNLKLADFGAAAQVQKDVLVNGTTGTAVYHTPEIHSRMAYSTYQADIFALSMTLFTITTGNMPFLSAKVSDPVYKFIVDGEFEKFWALHESLRASNCPLFSAEFKNLIESMLAFEVSERLNFEQIRCHTWVEAAAIQSEVKSLPLVASEPIITRSDEEVQVTDESRSKQVFGSAITC